ncbi:MAG: DNA gyrase subunit A [Christensenellales bacterium]|jgi:DNA gyrase subunit A
MAKEKAPAQSGRIIDVPMEQVMHSSMMPYAEYVILERALPRVEDGLKPVQRRILYTMLELSLTPDKPHRKSARIVGDTLGKYHPHGDTSVYDAMVRMAQGFNMREPLVDGHGNFGSIDGDSAAAMRYTEARLTPLAMELLKDIDKDTVPFSLNYDDALKEPDMLPGKYPNLLVNGSTGIAVGLATNIPPHNLKEAIDGVLAQIDNPDITVKQLMRYVKGPDFPTGGMVFETDELIKAYETGRGRLAVRAKTHIETTRSGKQLIVIDELPYQVNKAVMLEKILKLSEEKKAMLSGIIDIRDESDKAGIRAVIELKKDADADMVLNVLYKYSDLQVTFGANMVAIADGKPQQMGLRDINAHYINHQINVVTRRTKHELENALKREHILKALIIAVNNIDEVIALIRGSKNPAEAREKLMKRFKLDTVQAQAILDMRLQRLTSLQIIELRKEYDEIVALIKHLRSILDSREKLMEVIESELTQIKEKYATPRRTRIIRGEAPEAEIPEQQEVAEESVVFMTRGGFIKRMTPKAYAARNGDILDPPFIEVFTMTDQPVLFFTSQGSCFTIKAGDIPECKWKDKGALAAGLMAGLEHGETVVCAIDAGDYSGHLNFYTRSGLIKRSLMSQYETRYAKIAAISLKEGDSLVKVEKVTEADGLVLITKKGMSINVDNTQIPVTGRATTGVKGINMAEGDEIVFAGQVEDEGEIIIISDRGYAKRSLMVDYDRQGRNGKGLKTFDFRKNGANGYEVAVAAYVTVPYDIDVLQKNGEVTRINTEELLIEPRLSKGQPIIMVLMDNIVLEAYKII